MKKYFISMRGHLQKLDKYVAPRLPKYENNKFSYTFSICYWKETYPKSVLIIILFFSELLR